VLATPVVRVLRAAFPEARIDVAVAKEFAEVWQGNPYVSTVLELDKRGSALRGVMRSTLPGSLNTYDVVVDLQNNLRSLVLRHRFGSRVLVVDSFRAQKRALVQHHTNAAALPHVVQRYLATVAPLGVRDDGAGLDLWMCPDVSHSEARGTAVVHSSDSSSQHASQYRSIAIKSAVQPQVVVAPSAKHTTKRWPPELFARCIDMLVQQGKSVVVVGTKHDDALCADVMRHLRTAPAERVRTRKVISLQDTMRIMSSALCVVANDSSIVHIASACRVPVVDVFGSTVPEFGFTPYGTEHRIVQAQEGCRPCTHFGRSECPQGHFRCMVSIDPQRVAEAAAELCFPSGNEALE
jgi:heptosyltransferase-2